jgi:hypothetical protein
VRGQAGALQSPQVLASEPLFEGGSFAGRSLDRSALWAAAFCGNPRKLLTRWCGDARAAMLAPWGGSPNIACTMGKMPGRAGPTAGQQRAWAVEQELSALNVQHGQLRIVSIPPDCGEPGLTAES